MSYAKDQSPPSEAERAASVTGAPRAEGDETAATGHGARVTRRLDVLARSSAEPAAPPRLSLMPEHEAAAVRVAAWTNEAGTSADPDAAGDVVGRHEAGVTAAGTPFGAAGMTKPFKTTTV